jgi:hypothetical protein
LSRKILTTEPDSETKYKQLPWLIIAESLIEGQDVFGRNIRLNDMRRSRYKTALQAKEFFPVQDFLAYFFRRASGQGILGIRYTLAPEAIITKS